MLHLIALALILHQDSPDALLKRMQDAVRDGSQPEVTALFQKPADSDYLFRMASRCGGLKGLKVAVFPTPKGWESTGKYWATFHTWQELEQDHDPIYRVVDTPQGMELGSEIPESDCGGKIDSIGARAELYPDDGIVEVQVGLHITRSSPTRSLLFRLNDKYSFGAETDASGKPFIGRTRVIHGPLSFYVKTLDENKVEFQAPDSFRVGSLLAFNPSAGLRTMRFSYWAHIGNGAQYSEDRDQITKDRAYITSFWIPSLGRLPAPTDITIDAPSDWLVRSEGVLVGAKPSNDGLTETTYHCAVPISYPKVCAGKYVLALEGEQNGRVLRSYQFAPVDAKRATDDVGWMKKAIAFYEANLGPFPFKEYDCFDGKNYYGIESYSYTILDPTITTWAVSHEMGHTYFGGLVPCPYVKDSWNEGVTQYVDDVLLHHNPEVERNAMAGLGVHVPLTEMPVAWEYNGATYWRGAYSMEMLDAEIGHDKVLAGLQAMIRDREGEETTWPDLRQYFEKVSGEDLKWFWDQWITGSVFPHVSITSASAEQESGKWVTRVTVSQSGTPSPFRLRFAVRLSGDSSVDTAELMTEGEQTYEITTDSEPKQASINPVPTALVSVDAPVEVKGS